MLGAMRLAERKKVDWENQRSVGKVASGRVVAGGSRTAPAFGVSKNSQGENLLFFHARGSEGSA
jgi:hypothetical protein